MRRLVVVAFSLTRAMLACCYSFLLNAPALTWNPCVSNPSIPGVLKGFSLALNELVAVTSMGIRDTIAVEATAVSSRCPCTDWISSSSLWHSMNAEQRPKAFLVVKSK
jgi:hypothetical protein